MAALIAASQSGCGKPDNGVNPLGHDDQPGAGQVDLKNGYAAFGTQCPLGYNSDPKPLKLELWECPLNLQTVEMAEPLTPLMFQADCDRKTLTVRTLDRSVDSPWEVHPDGHFYFTVDGLNAKLRSDGAGNSDCTTPLSVDIWGQLDCTNKDKPKIKFETIMYLNRAPEPTGTSPTTRPSNNPNLPPGMEPGTPSAPATQPSGTPSGTPSGRPTTPTSPSATPRPVVLNLTDSFATRTTSATCRLPVGKCYFHAISSIDQCR